jgi:vacuolar-type H+-ATPase subunit H
MHEVIQKIIAAEAVAKGILETANAEAESILTVASQQAGDLAAGTGKEAVVEGRRMADTAIRAAEEEKQRLLQRALAEIKKQVRLDPETAGKVVDAVVRCVSKQDTIENKELP